MVDEYILNGLKIIFIRQVQIPLWSMSTTDKPDEIGNSQVGSDSSMVDEYGGSGNDG